MKLETIAEHTVCLDLLPECANILDLGCRGFQFTGALRMMGHEVYPVDMDYLGPEGYYQVAITNYVGFGDVYKNNDPQATRLNKRHDNQSDSSILTLTLERFSADVKVSFWDLIKIDIEGSEYEVIMSLTKPPAKQLSIEFHLHTGIYHMDAIQKMELHLGFLGYEPVQHEMTKQHGLGLNLWDSLWVLKP